jgi:hypothetical protein
MNPVILLRATNSNARLVSAHSLMNHEYVPRANLSAVFPAVSRPYD